MATEGKEFQIGGLGINPAQGGDFNVDNGEINSIEVYTNIAESELGNFWAYDLTDYFKAVGDGSPNCESASGKYTLAPGEPNPNGFYAIVGDFMSGDSGVAPVEINIIENILDSDKIGFTVDLYFDDYSDGWVKLATKSFCIDPFTVDEETDLTVTSQAGVLSERGAGTQTQDQDETASTTRDGTVSVNTIGNVIYGKVTTWTITGDPNYWYKITSIKGPDDVNIVANDAIGDPMWGEGCNSVNSHSSSCSGVIRINYFNEYDTITTATVYYNWYAKDPNSRFLSGDDDVTNITSSFDEELPLFGTGSIDTEFQLIALTDGVDNKGSLLLDANDDFQLTNKSTAIITGTAIVAFFGICLLGKRCKKAKNNKDEEEEETTSKSEPATDVGSDSIEEGGSFAEF